MLQRLVQRPGVPHGDEIIVILGAGPADLPALHQADRELHVERDLDSRAYDLPISLERVSIPDVEQRPGREDGERDRDAGAEPPVIHIPAVAPRGGGGDRLPAGRRDPEAAQHRRQRQRQVSQRRLGTEQDGRTSLGVHLPLRRRRLRWQLAHITRIDHVRRQAGRTPPPPPVRPQRIEPHRERVAHLGALNKERPGLGIAPTGDGLLIRVPPARVHRCGDNRVAVRDAQHRLVGADRRVVEPRLEAMYRHSQQPPSSRFSQPTCQHPTQGHFRSSRGTMIGNS